MVDPGTELGIIVELGQQAVSRHNTWVGSGRVGWKETRQALMTGNSGDCRSVSRLTNNIIVNFVCNKPPKFVFCLITITRYIPAVFAQRDKRAPRGSTALFSLSDDIEIDFSGVALLTCPH